MAQSPDAAPQTNARGGEKRWKPLESNPEVMNKYLSSLGLDIVKSPFEIGDVYGLDPDMLCMIPQPCAALLLVFPINAASEKYNAEVAEKVLSS